MTCLPPDPTSDPLWQAVFDATVDGILFLHPTGVITAANASAAALLGTTPASLVGLRIGDVIPNDAFPADQIPCSRPVRLPRPDGLSISASLEVRLIGDGRRIVFVRAWPNPSPASRPAACLASRGDEAGGPGTEPEPTPLAAALGDRQRMEDRISRANAALLVKDRAIEASIAAIAVADRAGCLTYVNRAFLSLWGYASLSEVVGRPATQFWVSPTAAEAVVEALITRGSWVGELAGQRRNGTRFTVQLYAAQLTDEAGQPLGMVGSFIDLTERDRTQIALRDNEERLRLALSGSNQGLFDLNLETGESTFTPEYAAMLGDDPVDFHLNVAGWRERLHPEDRDQAISTLGACIAGKTSSYAMEYRMRHRAGDWVWILSSGKVVPPGAPGRPARLLGIHLNITDRKLAEENRIELERRLLHAQKLESLGILAGGLAHDFNNLLMAILGNLDLALMDLPPESLSRPSIEQSIHAARRAADLTGQMLAYAGRGSFAIRSLDLGSLVEENAHLFRACVSRLVTFEVTTAPKLPPVRADAGQVQQVVMNLITNASEAFGSRPGTIQLRTGVAECDEALLHRSRTDVIPRAGRFVFVEVADTGCGMDEATLHRLFDPFFTTKFTGRGLGMSAVLGIMRGHEGAIFVESAPGRGTTVRVLFPVEPSPGPRAEPDAPPLPKTQTTDAPTGTILVVDDEAFVLRVCSLILSKSGWRVLEASEGPQAIAMFQQRADEITDVLLDLSMPKMSGIEVFHALRAIRPNTRIILTSGFSRDQALGKQLATEGLAGFMQKPFTAERMLQELALARQRTRP